jgi:hypothetical protein
VEIPVTELQTLLPLPKGAEISMIIAEVDKLVVVLKDTSVVRDLIDAKNAPGKGV